MKVQDAKKIAKPYCGSYDIKKLFELDNGDIMALGFGFDGGYGRECWCITHMTKHDGTYYWSTYGFESEEDAMTHMKEKRRPIVDTIEL